MFLTEGNQGNEDQNRFVRLVAFCYSRNPQQLLSGATEFRFIRTVNDGLCLRFIRKPSQRLPVPVLSLTAVHQEDKVTTRKGGNLLDRQKRKT